MATITEPKVATADGAEEACTSERESDQGTGRRRKRKKTFAGRLAKETVMMMRRVHLYSGIFMFPFVLLYGFSGWFFNHPGYFRDGKVTKYAAAEAVGGRLAELPSAAAVAASVVEEMNLESFLIDGPEIKLSDEKTPRFGGFYTFTVNADQATHTVTVNPVDGSGTIQTVPVESSADNETPPPPNPLAGIQSASLQDNPLESSRDLVPQLLTELGLPSGEALTGRRTPNVVFTVEADGVPCVVSYNLGTGGVSSLRQDARASLDLKDQLRRMHLARMYTPQFDLRWFWALIVDAMFVSMVFWGVSGLSMWWQVKRTRVLGGGVLLASLVVSAVMFIGMHDNLTENARRRGGGRPARTASPESTAVADGAAQTKTGPTSLH